MAPKRPSFQWYPGDWLKDPGVRALSYAAKGLWFDMLNLMDQAPRRGHLQLESGQPVTAATLARMTGGATGEVVRLLRELETAGVYSSTAEGIIYSRRMVRDEQTREADAGRQRRSRARKRGSGGDRHAPVTPMSQRSSSSSSTSVRGKDPPAQDRGTADPAVVYRGRLYDSPSLNPPDVGSPAVWKAVCAFLGCSPANLGGNRRQAAERLLESMQGPGIDHERRFIQGLEEAGKQSLGFSDALAFIRKRGWEKADQAAKGSASPVTRTPGAGSPMSAESRADDAKARAARADLKRRFDEIPHDQQRRYAKRLHAEHKVPALELAAKGMMDFPAVPGFLSKWLPVVVAMHEGETK